jgi:CheY-like chemotaxis protein
MDSFKIGIYCVDDDPMITEILLFQLSKALGNEFSIETENNPENVLNLMRSNLEYGIEPFVCIVDFQMPVIRGDELCRMLKKEFPKIKIIMLSGNSNALLVSDLEEDGLLEVYMEKPWIQEDLLRNVNSCLPLNLKFK